MRPSRATAETEAAAGAPRAEGEFPHRSAASASAAANRRCRASWRGTIRRRRAAGARSASHGAAVRAAGGPARTGVTIAKRNAREKHRALADLAATRGPARQSADVATVTGAVRRGPGGRDGQRGRGRDAAPRRVEQKLYTLELMVDRGFEDVPDEAEDSGTRRVHWTIVKRTVADQKSGKPMSATYVLQREGGETEFPNLGAARAAANKTIVHPEKLTMSKAEHAAAKNSK